MSRLTKKSFFKILNAFEQILGATDVISDNTTKVSKHLKITKKTKF